MSKNTLALVAASEGNSDIFQMGSLWSLAMAAKFEIVWYVRMYVRLQKSLSLAFMHSQSRVVLESNSWLSQSNETTY